RQRRDEEQEEDEEVLEEAGDDEVVEVQPVERPLLPHPRVRRDDRRELVDGAEEEPPGDEQEKRPHDPRDRRVDERSQLARDDRRDPAHASTSSAVARTRAFARAVTEASTS